MGMRRAGAATVVIAIALWTPACADAKADRVGNDLSSAPTGMLGPDIFPCTSRGTEVGYQRYGVGRMRRGGLEREELEPDHIVIGGHGVNFHGSERVHDGGTIEIELDEDYFAPTIVRGPAGATVTIELHNDGVRPHSFWVPGQGIDLHCGVRSADRVEVRLPAAGILTFACRYGATSGIRGALRVAG